MKVFILCVCADCVISEIHLHTSFGLGFELLLERPQEGGIEVGGLRHSPIHDFPHCLLIVGFKVGILLGITAQKLESNVGDNGCIVGAAQTLHRGNVADNLWKDGLEAGVATDQSRTSLRDIEAECNINAACCSVAEENKSYF